MKKASPPAPAPDDSPPPAMLSAHIRREISDLIAHLDADRERVEDPHLQGMLASAAAVLRGLDDSFAAYDDDRAARLGLHE